MHTTLDTKIAERLREAHNEALEKAAVICERMQPHGGRAWTAEQAACFAALGDAADNIRKLKT